MTEGPPQPIRQEVLKALEEFSLEDHIEALRVQLLGLRASMELSDAAREKIDANIQSFVSGLRERYGAERVDNNLLVQMLINPWERDGDEKKPFSVRSKAKGKAEQAKREQQAEDFPEGDSVLAFARGGFGLTEEEIAAFLAADESIEKAPDVHIENLEEEVGRHECGAYFLGVGRENAFLAQQECPECGRRLGMQSIGLGGQGQGTLSSSATIRNNNVLRRGWRSGLYQRRQGCLGAGSH